MMRTPYPLAQAALILGFVGLSAPAMAQMYPGEGITVDPGAAGIQGPLLQPGEPYPGTSETPPAVRGGTSTHRRHHHHTTAAASPTVSTAAAPTDAATQIPDQSATPSPDSAPPVKHSRHHKTDVAAQSPDSGSATSGSLSGTIPFTFGEDSTTPPASSSPAHAQDKAAPAAKNGGNMEAGLAKRGAILFAPDATNPTPAQFDGIKLLAGDLNSAIEAGATRIQLEAYGGARGDKSSDARRLSLKRALAIRQLLIDNGVPSNRIDVRAMGGATDQGEADRVDVYVRTS
jgi:outer membrane protein OmpA-like peptidoglycan-associated protein